MSHETITLALIDEGTQDVLRNTVGSPLTQEKRVRAYNRVMDYLQANWNWNPTKRIAQFDFLPGETDYNIEDDIGVDDFKDIYDLRRVDDSDGRHTDEYYDIGEKKFSLLKGLGITPNRITIEERDNVKVLRILSNITSGRTIIHQMDELDSNGTWASDTSTSDATTLAEDANKKKEGSGSLRFNIDVSQSGNNYAEIATTTVFSSSFDATDLENIGYFRFWLGLHSMSTANLALITGVTFRWGSSASDYWEVTATTPVNTGTFKAAWNRMSFKWSDATETGTPDESALDYFAIRITYSSGMTDTNNIRVDEIVMLEPTEMELVYFSNSFVKDGTTLQARFTTSSIDTTEVLLLPAQFLETFINLSLLRLFPQKEDDNSDYVRISRETEEQLDAMVTACGNAIVREQENLRIEGTASNRADTEGRQW